MTVFNIRAARITDAPDVARIWLDGQRRLRIPCPERNYQEDFERKIAHLVPPFGLWVAVTLEERVIGWQALSATMAHPGLTGRFAESSTYVDESLSARGVGRALLAHALSHAIGTTLRYVTGYVSVDNPAALRITELLGFERLGQLPLPPDGEGIPHVWSLVRPLWKPFMPLGLLVSKEEAITMPAGAPITMPTLGESPLGVAPATSVAGGR